MATLNADALRSTLEHHLDAIDCAGTFYSHQQVLELVNPGLNIAGLGRFGSPLYERDVRALIGARHQSPFGKGEDTIVDTDVRRSWEIDAANISFTHPNWAWNEKQFLDTACTQLGVGGGSMHVRAELYKLLIYEEGAMFKAHKDSEKAPGMFATMVVCLPGPHEGGDVALTFNGQSTTLATDSCSEWQYSVLAWYADVLHEVKPVRSGFRVALTYNLIYNGQGPPPNLLQLDESKAGLREILTNWRRTLSEGQDLPSFIAYPFEHKYTEANISLQHLKRRDAARTLCMSQVALEYDFQCCLATLEKCVTSQDDEEQENELELKSVTNLDGHTLLQRVSVSEDIVTHDIGDGDADEEEEESTGNAGVERTHWYRDCVLLIMPSSHYVDLAMSASKGFYSSGSKTRQAFIDTCLAEAHHSRHDHRKTGYLRRICEIILKQPAPKQYDYGSDRYPDDLAMQLIASCTQLGFHHLVEHALRSASPYMANLVVENILLSVPVSGFPDALHVTTALSRLDVLKSRMDSLERVTAVMRENGMANEAQIWQVERPEQFLSMPLGQQDEVMPILEDMIQQQKNAAWVTERLLPALQSSEANIGILTTFAARFMILANSLSFERSATTALYSQLAAHILHGLWLPEQKPASPRDDSDGPFSLSYGWNTHIAPNITLPVKPDDLARAHWNLVELQLLDEASSLSAKVIEEAMRMDAKLLPELVPLYLRSMVLHWPLDNVAYNDSHYQMLFSNLLSTYIHRHVQAEPRATWVKKPVGCGQCQECNELDRFFLDPNRKSYTMSIYYKRDVDHIERQCTYRHSSFLRLVSESYRRNPYTLTAHKQMGDHEAEYRPWKVRANNATKAIKDIAEEAILREILGARYEELTMLLGVRALPMGHEIQAADTPGTRPPGQYQVSSAVVGDPWTMPAQAAGIKRKHDWIQDDGPHRSYRTNFQGASYASRYQPSAPAGQHGGSMPFSPHLNAGLYHGQQQYSFDPAVGYRSTPSDTQQPM